MTHARLILSILEAFQDSSLYEDYQEEDNWTDEQFDEALAWLREIAQKPAESGERRDAHRTSGRKP